MRNHRKNDNFGLQELKWNMDKAKIEFEKELERSIITNENYLDLTKKDI